MSVCMTAKATKSLDRFERNVAYRRFWRKTTFEFVNGKHRCNRSKMVAI